MSWVSSSQYSSSSLNPLVARLRPHPVDGRHQIDFNHELTGTFVQWCNTWADGIQFKRLEYRKDINGLARHQFICLRDLRRSPSFLPHELGSKQNALWEGLGDGLANRICLVERMADPDTPINALVRADAMDYVNIFEEDSQTAQKRLPNSSVLLEIAFENYRSLSEVIDICYGITSHPKSRYYTLQQYNCYFYCWNIILGLVHPQTSWISALADGYQGVVCDSIDESLQEYVSTDGDSKLALVASIPGSIPDEANAVQPPIIRAISDEFRRESSLGILGTELKSVFWTSERDKIISSSVYQVLREVAIQTTDFVSRGTGSSDIYELFHRDPAENPLDFPPDWRETIEKEYKYLFEKFVNDIIWPLFKAQLESRSQIKQSEPRPEIPLIQRARSSNSILKFRLSGLGTKTAWRNARAAAGGGNSLVDLLKTVVETPAQLGKIWDISDSFVSIVAAEMHRSAATGEPMKINGVGDHLLELVEGSDLDFSGIETAVVAELEWSIKRIALAHPDHDHHALRMATLQVLMKLRKRGEQLKFCVMPLETWHMCLWHSLGGCVIQSISGDLSSICGASEPKYKCQKLVKVSTKKFSRMLRCEMTYSKIEEFVLARVRKLSEKANKDGLRLSGPCMQEIQQTMFEIWAKRKSWRACLD